MPGADYRSPASPVRFHGANDGPKGPAPQIGQHTETVLAEIGFSQVAIEALREAGAIPHPD